VAEFATDVAVPTLLVAAERDDIAPPAAQRVLAGRFPDARLVMVPDTGHLAHYETPAAVALAITGFLEALG
jgi:pimeloyl-ACP methyl ester carboxylesterase